MHMHEGKIRIIFLGKKYAKENGGKIMGVGMLEK